MTTVRSLVAVSVVVVLAAVLAACVSAPSSTPAATDGPTGIATAAPVIAAVPTGTNSTAAGAELRSPPMAEIGVEGGDPVEGQLGTYVWDGGGSDSPWLPGTPVAAGAGEVLSVTLSPWVAMSDWSAVIAPSTDVDGSGAIRVGAGPAPMDVTAPGPGAWTLAVTIEFGDRGSATWSWRLEVS